MKEIVRTSSGKVWREVETSAEATAVGEATRTAFGWFFDGRVKGVVPNRYFALGDDYAVIGCVAITPEPKGKPGFGLPLFVAYANANPFKEYAQEIGELARAIDVKITGSHYPYQQWEDAGEIPPAP